MTKKDFNGNPVGDDGHPLHQAPVGLAGGSSKGIYASGTFESFNPKIPKHDDTFYCGNRKNEMTVTNTGKPVQNTVLEVDNVKDVYESKIESRIAFPVGEQSDKGITCQSQTRQKKTPSKPVPCVDHHVESEYVFSRSDLPCVKPKDSNNDCSPNLECDLGKAKSDKDRRDLREQKTWKTIPPIHNAKHENPSVAVPRGVPPSQGAARFRKVFPTSSTFKDASLSTRIHDKVDSVNDRKNGQDSGTIRSNTTDPLHKQKSRQRSCRNRKRKNDLCKSHTNNKASNKGYFENPRIGSGSSFQILQCNGDRRKTGQRAPVKYFDSVNQQAGSLNNRCYKNDLMYQDIKCEKKYSPTKDGGYDRTATGGVQNKLTIDNVLARQSVTVGHGLTDTDTAGRLHDEPFQKELDNDTFDESLQHREQPEEETRQDNNKIQIKVHVKVSFLALLVFFLVLIDPTDCAIEGMDMTDCSVECCADSNTHDYCDADEQQFGGTVPLAPNVPENGQYNDMQLSVQEGEMCFHVMLQLALFLCKMFYFLLLCRLRPSTMLEVFEVIGIDEDGHYSNANSREAREDMVSSSHLSAESLMLPSNTSVTRDELPRSQSLSSGLDSTGLASGNTSFTSQATRDLPDSGYRGDSQREVTIEVIFEGSSSEFQVSPTQHLDRIIQRVRRIARYVVNVPAELVINMLPPPSSFVPHGLVRSHGRDISSLTPQELASPIGHVTRRCFVVAAFPAEVAFYRQPGYYHVNSDLGGNQW